MRLLKIFVALWLLSTTAFADDSAKMIGYPSNKIMGFLGLDTKANAPLLADGRAVDLQNVVLDSSFNLTKRYGYSVINNTLDGLHDYNYTEVSSPAVTGIFDAHFSDTTQLFVMGGDFIKYDNSGTWTDITGTLTFTSSQFAQWKCTMAYDNAVCSNDLDEPVNLSSTPSYTQFSFGGLSDELTRFKDSLFFQNYLIVLNTTEASTDRPTRFRWSNVGDVATWDDDDFVDIAALGGDQAYAIKDLKGQIYVFLGESIYRFSLVGGDDVFTNTKAIEGIGTISRDSVQNVKIQNELGLIFLSKNKHIYFFNGYNLVDIGERIQPTLDTINESRIQNAVSFYDDKQYCVSVATSGLSNNDKVYCYQTEIGEWYKFTDINANVFARVVSSDDTKTYFGNYDSFVYLLNNPDRPNDVDGATGVVDSVGRMDVATETNAQVIIDSDLPDGLYTGATIKITSGTGQNQEAVILTMTDTSVVVTTAFDTEPDSTSNYSIGAINSYYETKWYEFGMSQRLKLFRWIFLWAKEDTDNEIDVSFKIDFGDILGSETVNLSPDSSSLWDVALWDEGIWGSTGDLFEIVDINGRGRFFNFKISNDDIDETFNLYGYHLIADALDVK